MSERTQLESGGSGLFTMAGAGLLQNLLQRGRAAR